MIVSPSSSTSASAAIVWSVISPAGTITHAVRGLSSFETNSSERRRTGGTVVDQSLDGVRRDVIGDAVVSVLHQPPDETGAHPSKPNHSELHRRLRSCFFAGVCESARH